MAARGRKPLEVELRLREQIESFYFNGLGPAAIRDALASKQNTTPVELSVRQVQAYLRSSRKGWVRSIDPAALQAERAELVANLKDTARTAASASARYRDSSVGVGYANTRIKAISNLARLEGLIGGPASSGSTSTGAPGHPYERLSPDEQPANLRRLADIIEETR
ncbi:MAG: hypothetical protein ABSA21_06240 [Candidatus Limnocylindrales bacterium]